MDLHPVSLDSTPAMSHWWQQEGHLAKSAPVGQQKSHLGRYGQTLEQGVDDVKFGRLNVVEFITG